jgi:DNA-damage-inducible protein J
LQALASIKTVISGQGSRAEGFVPGVRAGVGDLPGWGTKPDGITFKFAFVSHFVYNVLKGGFMQSATEMIHVRIDPKLKSKATKAFGAMGLTLSEAVRVFLTRAATDQAFPFELRVPNVKTVAAMKAGDRGEIVKFNSVEELMADLHADD